MEDEADGVTKMNPILLQELRELYDTFDFDNSDSLDYQELSTIIRSLGVTITDQELIEILGRADETFTFHDLVQLVQDNMAEAHRADEVKEMFRLFDKDGDGFIDSGDVCLVMKSLGLILSKDVCEEMIQEASGGNKAEKVSMVEFINMMNKLKSDRERNRAT